MLAECSMLGSPGLSMVLHAQKGHAPEANSVRGTFSSWVCSCDFLLIVLLSVVLSSRAGESFSNALLWKFVWAYCNLPKCPQLDSEDLFCNLVQISIGFLQRCHFVILMNAQESEIQSKMMTGGFPVFQTHPKMCPPCISLRPSSLLQTHG